MSEMEKTAILLLSFGGADSMDNVEPFLKNVLAPRPVSPELLKSAKERYMLIGGRSPILDKTMEIARDLEFSLLHETGRSYRVYVGMRHWNPFIKDTLARMRDDGITRAIAVILAPHQTPASTGGYNRDVEAARNEVAGAPTIEFASPWHMHPRYLMAVLEKINSTFIDLQHIVDKTKILLLFSAHSLPVSLLENDPYVDMIEETIENITGRLRVFEHRLAFQSKGGGPVEWKGPSVEEVIDEAKANGKTGILLVPIGFVTDHVETLYDIDILFKERAEKQGMTFVRARSLNASDRFIETLTDVVKRHLQPEG